MPITSTYWSLFLEENKFKIVSCTKLTLNITTLLVKSTLKNSSLFFYGKLMSQYLIQCFCCLPIAFLSTRLATILFRCAISSMIQSMEWERSFTQLSWSKDSLRLKSISVAGILSGRNYENGEILS